MRHMILTASLLLFLVLLYSMRTQNRFAHLNLKQFILDSFFSQEANIGIEKDASTMTVDCNDWNLVVELASHPLGPPHQRRDFDQNNAPKEHTRLTFKLTGNFF